MLGDFFANSFGTDVMIFAEISAKNGVFDSKQSNYVKI
jgi:hypothetical protein